MNPNESNMYEIQNETSEYINQDGPLTNQLGSQVDEEISESMLMPPPILEEEDGFPEEE